jgi:hypothetical protein
MKQLIKIDYFCDKVKTGGSWYVLDSKEAPSLGIINMEPFAGGPMPSHRCMRYYDHQDCDAEKSCNWQRIEEIKPFSEEEAKNLRAENLEFLIEKGLPAENFIN